MYDKRENVMRAMRFVGKSLIVAAIILLLVTMHIACLDPFDTNFWYLYILAGVLAAAQYALLILVYRMRYPKLVSQLLLLMYSVATVIKFLEIIDNLRFAEFSIDTWVFCNVLDLIGALICVFGSKRCAKV